MLLCIIVPPSLGATSTATDTRTDFDCLNSEEQAYVTGMQGAIAHAKDSAQTARADLGTVFLQGYEDWYKAFPVEVAQMNIAIDAVRNMQAPGTFSGVAAQAQKLEGVGVGHVKDVFDPYEVPMHLPEVAREVALFDEDFGGIIGDLNDLNSALDKRVAEVAKLQRMGEDILGSMLSCDETTTN
jgi:hypothetical protein